MNYVAKTPNGKVFDNSLAKNAPYYIRVGSGAVIPVCRASVSASWTQCRHAAGPHENVQKLTGPHACDQGLDEALLGMSTGSIRRVYIPGELAFPKGLASAPGR